MKVGYLDVKENKCRKEGNVLFMDYAIEGEWAVLLAYSYSSTSYILYINSYNRRLFLVDPPENKSRRRTSE